MCFSIAMPEDDIPPGFPNPPNLHSFPKRRAHVHRPARRPRAWKKNGPRKCCCQQPEPAAHAKLPVLTTNQHPSPSLKEHSIPAAEFQSAALAGVQPKNHTDTNSIQGQTSADDLSSQDTSEYDLESTDDGSVDVDSHLASNEITAQTLNHKLTENRVEALDRQSPASEADVQEPASDMSLHNVRNVSQWASTVSKEEIERIRGMALAVLVESFRQDATAHLGQTNHPTVAACLNPISDGNVDQGSITTRTPEASHIDSGHHATDENLPHVESYSASECNEDFRGTSFHASDTDVFQPEALYRQISASCTDVQTPGLDMSMFDDRDIQQWPDSLSRGEREWFLEADLAACNQSFRQYAATHLRQPTSQPIASLNPTSDEIVDHEGSIATRTPEDSPIRCGHHAPDESAQHDDSCSASECNEDLAEADFAARNQFFRQYPAAHLRQPTSQPIACLNPMSDEIVDREGSIATRTPEDSPIRCGRHAPDENVPHDNSCSASECDEDVAGNASQASDTDLSRPEMLDPQIPASKPDVHEPNTSMYNEGISQCDTTRLKEESKRLRGMTQDLLTLVQSSRQDATTHHGLTTPQSSAPCLNPISDKHDSHEPLATSTPEDSQISSWRHPPDEDLAHDDSCSASERSEGSNDDEAFYYQHLPPLRPLRQLWRRDGKSIDASHNINHRQTQLDNLNDDAGRLCDSEESDGFD